MFHLTITARGCAGGRDGGGGRGGGGGGGLPKPHRHLIIRTSSSLPKCRL